MPKSKEFISSDEVETASDSDSEPQPKKKKKVEKKSKGKSEKAGKSSDTQTDKEGNVMFPLSKTRFAVVSEFRGKKMVNIREYYTADDGELRPGRKGISLSLEQWSALKGAIPEIDDLL